MLKIITYNVNGIRAALNKDLIGYLTRENADIVCFQEIKANEEDIPNGVFEELGYQCFWYPAAKKGYSGVGILSKIKPISIKYGCGNELYDNEGRILQIELQDMLVLSCYFPSGTTGDERQTFKYEFLDFFFNYIESLKKNTTKGIVVCGDYNICNKTIDIHDPVSNKNSSGFLPQEREWMDKWFDNGMIDTFRHLNPQPHQYTWWSYRAGARSKNKGWRIDYISISDNLKDKLSKAGIHPHDMQSDHCGSYVILI